MSREILFRAKRLDNGEWIEGFYAVISSKTVIIARNTKKYISVGDIVRRKNGNEVVEVDPKTICQYTGLTDSNGHKIWENDIVQNIFGKSYAPIKYGSYTNCFDSTKVEHIGFYVDWKENFSIRKDLGYWVNMVNAETNGNIFDNPELLEWSEE